MPSCGKFRRQLGIILRIVGGCAVLAASANRVFASETLFEISRFTLTYGLAHPSLPSPDELTRIEVPIGTAGGVFVPANTPGAAITTLPLANLPAGARFSLPAIVAVMEGVVGELNRRDLQVVFVRPDARQINLAESTDLRAADDRSLHLIVWVGQIAEVRTIAKGERFSRPARST